MFVCIFFHFLYSIRKPIYNATNKVFVGAVSTVDNPFWSQKIPGIHYCDEQYDSQHEYQIYYSFGERQQLIPFNLTKSNEYHHCDYLILKESAEHMKSIAKENSYLRFYQNNRWEKVHFSTIQNGTLQYFSTYLITIFNEFNFTVASFDPKPIKEGSHIVFSFHLNLIHNNSIQANEEFPIKKNYLILYIISFIFLIIIVAIISYNALTNSSVTNPSISISEIWRIPHSFSYTIRLTSFGILCISSFLFICYYKKPNENCSKYLYTSLIIGNVLAVALPTVIYNFLKILSGFQMWITAILLVDVFYIFPIHFINFFFGLSGSDRGGSTNSIVFDFLFFFLSFILSKAIGKAALFLTIKNDVEASSQISNVPKKKEPVLSKFLFVLEILFSIFLFFPLCEYFFNVCFSDTVPDLNAFASTFLVYITFSGICSLIRTLSRIKEITKSWIEDHIKVHLIVAIIVAFLCIRIMLFEHKVRSFQVFITILVYIIPFAMSVLAVGVAASFLTSFVMMKFSLNQSKLT